MANIFDGLEKFGLSEYKRVELFDTKAKGDTDGTKAAPKAFNIRDYIYAKEFDCPVCGKTFSSNIMRIGKTRLISIEHDLRPIYSPLEPIFYDNIVCVKCGYSAVKQLFSNIREFQIDLITEQLLPKYTPVIYPDELTVDMAIERYKLTLLNSYVKNAKDGEKAYICMKLCWLYRIKGDKENELVFARLTKDGFLKAYNAETAPIMGLEENTVMYIIAAFAKTLGENEEALRYLSKIVVSRSISSTLKERARDLRDIIVNKQHAEHV